MSHGQSCVRVSVIVPTYNRATELKRCLDSLAKQSFKDFEVIVSDDGSTDNTRGVVQAVELSLRARYLYQSNSGLPASARNLGLAVAEGEFIAFLDSDDWWHPDKLLLSVNALDAGADVVYHDLLRKPKKRYWIRNHRVRSRALQKPVRDCLITRGNCIPNSSVVLRRHLIDTVGGFSEDPALRAWEDFDLWLRIGEVTDDFTRIRGAWGSYWIGGGNITTAQTTLSYLDEIRKRHLVENTRLPTWFLYGIGWAKFRLGDRYQARAYLYRSLGTHGPPRIQRDRLKAVGMLLLTYVPTRKARRGRPGGIEEA